MEWHLLKAQPWQVAQDGWLVAQGSWAWVTRQGDADDHVLAPGALMPVRAGEQLWLGPWTSEATGARAGLAHLSFVPGRAHAQPRAADRARAWLRTVVA